MKLIYNL